MAVLHEKAFRDDVAGMVRWLESAHPDWLLQLDEDLTALEELLERHPEIGVPFEVKRRQLRKFYLRESPYVAWYDLPEPGVIRMLRLFHAHADRPIERRPRRIRRRR